MMSWRYINLISFLSVIIVSGCVESDYTKLVRTELGKGIKKDSLLLGIYFNDSKKEFYRKCFELNKQKLVAQGPSNAAVEYSYADSLHHNPPRKVRLLFYPKFDSQQILNQMDLEFSYLGWAPWNKAYQADKLLPIVKQTLMEWYGGNSFIEIKIEDQAIPVKVDGNRRIMLYIKDTQSVIVKIQNLNHKNFKHSHN